jgi:hypothetical protein
MLVCEWQEDDFWYAMGRQVARSFFHRTSKMFTDAFDEVDWPHVSGLGM